MTRRTQTPPRSVAGSAVFLICLVIAAAGLALDFGLGPRPQFWIVAQPGMAAAAGVGAAVFAALAARVAQLALARGRAGDASKDQRP